MVAAIAAACGGGSSDASADPSAAASGAASEPPALGAAAVRMVDGNAFEPADITVSSGETITWTNASGSIHTVTDDPDNPLGLEHILPDGAEPFNSGNIAPGGTFELALEVPGTYEYTCALHRNMSGTITVD